MWALAMLARLMIQSLRARAVKRSMSIAIIAVGVVDAVLIA